MNQRDINQLALIFNRALKAGYFNNLQCYTSWEQAVETGSVSTIVDTLLRYTEFDIDHETQLTLARES